MSLVNIDGNDHVLLGAPFVNEIKILNSDELGEYYGHFFQPVASFQVAGFATIFFDGYRPNRYAGIGNLPVPIGAPPPRPESGYLYPRRTQ